MKLYNDDSIVLLTIMIYFVFVVLLSWLFLGCTTVNVHIEHSNLNVLSEINDYRESERK